jgi:LacI family transcriptional regulator
LQSKEQSNIDALLRVQVEGIIASIASETTDYSHFKRAISRGVPLVLFDRVNEELGVNTVVNDDYRGGVMAVDHLVEQGCTKIAHFMGKKHLNIYKERLRGYKDALRKHNLPINENWILQGDLIDETEQVLETGRRLTHKLLENDGMPDAIFSSSDFAAMGAMQVLKEKNIKIPDEVALVGFSNDLSTSFIDPPLTSVDQHTRQMGELAAQVFLQQINSNTDHIPFDTTLKPELIIRASSMQKAKMEKTQQAL